MAQYDRSVMVDIETKSTDANAFILSIGAVAFDDNGFLRTYEKVNPVVFYGQVQWEDPAQQGRSVDNSTLEWWGTQSKARRVLQRPEGEQLQYVYPDGKSLLEAFNAFVKEARTMGGFVIARPATFDLVIIKQAMKYFGITPSWGFRSERCMTGVMEAAWRAGVSRTWSVPVASHKDPIAHHAGDDAIWQTALWVFYNHAIWKLGQKTAQAPLFGDDGPRLGVAP
jgi:hypothetical protein